MYISQLFIPITKDLGIDDLYTRPRFSYQFPNSTLPEHIDQDRIIGLNINFIDFEINFGSPSSQWWLQLSNAIVFGVMFSFAKICGADGILNVTLASHPEYT